MSLNLYQIKNEYLMALDALGDDHDDQAIKDTLEGMEGEIKDKLVTLAAYAKSIEAEREAITNAINEMEVREDRLDAKASSIRKYIQETMEQCSVGSVKHEWFEISIKNNPPSVAFTCDADIPEKFIHTTTIKRPDTAAIKTAIKAGEDVPGCVLVSKKRLSIK